MKKFKAGMYNSVINWKFSNIHFYLTQPKFVEKYLLPSKEKRVLELGCGYGRETQILGDLFKEAIGIDGGAKTIQKARQLAIKKNKENVKFLVYPTEIRSLKPESFDCIFSDTVLQHCSDDVVEVLLLDAILMLKKGGRFLLEFINRHNTEKGIRYEKFGFCDIPRSDEEVKKLLENVGLSIETIEHKYYPGKSGGLVGWYAGRKKVEIHEIKSNGMSLNKFNSYKNEYFLKSIRNSTIVFKEVFGNKKLKGAEIGVAGGVNAITLNETLNMEKLYLIDIWDTFSANGEIYDATKYYEEVKNIFKNYENVEIIKDDSIKVAKTIEDNTLDFVYIDGNHQYEYVKKDIEAWYPKVKKGGYVAGHDYTKSWKGVKKAVDEFVEKHNYKLNVKKNRKEATTVDWWFKKENEK